MNIHSDRPIMPAPLHLKTSLARSTLPKRLPFLRFLLTLFCTTTFLILTLLVVREYASWIPVYNHELSPDETYLLAQVENFVRVSELYPVPTDNFAEMGHRLRLMLDWVQLAETLDNTRDPAGLGRQLWIYLERLAASHTSFLSRTGLSRPLHTMLFSGKSGRGIVIPVGNVNFHLACHLIANIREILHSTQLIEIAFAGETDLSRDRLEFMINSWTHIQALDVSTRLNDSTLQLAIGRYAVKPFAALVSRFEEVILVDADAVFLQKPENLFEEPGYQDTGAFLFKDRAIWAGHDRFHEAWWQTQFKELEPMSDNIAKSRAMQEGFSEHGESGVVVLDKSRHAVTMALLHTCWQNTYEVRNSRTYVEANGDKESFWFGMEALGTPYAMEESYAAALGFECQEEGPTEEKRICSTNIAHLDHQGHLLWWNGGLYHDKSAVQLTFSRVPTAWMVDGVWNPALPGSYSSMTGAEGHLLSPREYEVVYKTFERAAVLDRLTRIR